MRNNSPLSVLALLLGLLAVCCAPAGKLRSLSQAEEEAVYAELVAESDSGRAEAVLAKARQLAARSPSFPRLDRVYFLAARACSTLGDLDGVVRYSRAVEKRFPGSSYREGALLLAAFAYKAQGRYLESADRLGQLLTLSPGEDLGAKARELLTSLLAGGLEQGQVEKLLQRYPNIPLAEDISLQVARKEYARGNYRDSYRLLSELIYKFPQHPRAPEIRRLLRSVSEKLKAPLEQPTYVDPYRIGVVVPVTGDFSPYGRRFLRGAELAVDEYNTAASPPVTLVKADSRGNPIDGVRAVKRLIHQEGVSAILGGLLTVPTISEATEADAWGVPFLSTLAENGRLDEIGRWVFQTKVPGEVEVAALARFAVNDLMLSRFAVLAPASDEKRKLAKFFTAEVGRMGGVVVAQEYYPSGATDFKAYIERIGASSPEALFLPAQREELLMILPQLRFYDVRVQLLGLSDWNAEKVIKVSSKEMEGAIFPKGSYQGRDRAAYQAFITLYRDRFQEEPDAVAVAGYFGARLLLEGIIGGALGREELGDYLLQQIGASAEARMAEAKAMSIMTVRSGKVEEILAGEQP